jgi:hypothetical protein
LTERQSALGYCNIYCLPLSGPQSENITTVLLPELVNCSSDRIRFFSEPGNPADSRLMQRIADDLASPDQSMGFAQVGMLMRNLERLYQGTTPGGDLDAPERQAPDAGPTYVTVALSGRVTQCDEEDDEEAYRAKVAITLNMHNVQTNQNLWAANIAGEHIEPRPQETPMDRVKDDFESLITLRNIVIAVGVFAALFILFAMFRMMTTPR